jgi:hypothetical protein
LRQELRQNGFLDQIFTYDVDRARKNLWQARRSVQIPLPKTTLEANNSIPWFDFVMLLKVGRQVLNSYAAMPSRRRGGGLLQVAGPNSDIGLQSFNARAQLGHTGSVRMDRQFVIQLQVLGGIRLPIRVKKVETCKNLTAWRNSFVTVIEEGAITNDTDLIAMPFGSD